MVLCGQAAVIWTGGSLVSSRLDGSRPLLWIGGTLCVSDAAVRDLYGRVAVIGMGGCL